jgi:hypothetical protein
LRIKIFQIKAQAARNSGILGRFVPTVGALGDAELVSFKLNTLIDELIEVPLKTAV